MATIASRPPHKLTGPSSLSHSTSTKRAATPSSSSSTTSKTTSKRRDNPRPKLTDQQRAELAERLAILATIRPPLPPTLPLSPPLSPKSLKRKSPDATAISEQGGKKARRDIDTSIRSHAGASGSSSKKEDGELEDPSSSTFVPKRKRAPRARRSLSDDQVTKLCDQFQSQARSLKRSGERRIDRATSRLLPGNLYGLLEQTDAVLHFAYAFWTYGYARVAQGSWESIEGFLVQCRAQWEKIYSELPATEEERRGKVKVLLGLLELIRWCSCFHVQRLLLSRLRAASEHGATSPGNVSASPPGLHNQAGATTHPSPASSASSGQPRPSNGVSPQHLAPTPQPPNSSNMVSVPSDVMRMQNKLLHASTQLSQASHYASYLTMNALRKYYPETYEVCAGDNDATGAPLASGKRDDCLQVDLDLCVKGQGEWAWPIANGEDVPHAVGFGRSLLWEFGQSIGGYHGVEGVWKWEDGTSFRPKEEV